MAAFSKNGPQPIRCSNQECPNHQMDDTSEVKFEVKILTGHNREVDEELCEIDAEYYKCLECGEKAEEV